MLGVKRATTVSMRAMINIKRAIMVTKRATKWFNKIELMLMINTFIKVLMAYIAMRYFSFKIL